MIAKHSNYSLKERNTFGFDVSARTFITADTMQDLQALRHDSDCMQQQRLVVGAGSNLLFLHDFDGCVIHPAMADMAIVGEDEQSVWLRVGAGVPMDEVVQHCVEMGWYGLENLSLIPGCVGAAPVQNIGAYGVEVKDCIDKVEYLCWDDFSTEALSGAACKFGYRSSIFKNEMRGKACITHVTFCVSRRRHFNLSYGGLDAMVNSLGGANLRNVREAIVRTRNSKLPDPAQFGNAGSFFKNPVVARSVADAVASEYPNMPRFDVGRDVKIPAAWLIENVGYKGVRRGNAGVHAKQPLVLLNYGASSGQEVLALADEICDAVQRKFGIALEKEVNVVG